MNIYQLIYCDEKLMKCQFCDYRCCQQFVFVWYVRKYYLEVVLVVGLGRMGGFLESLGQEEVGVKEYDDEDI